MALNTVLICDDNDSIHTGLVGYLKEENTNVISVYTGKAAVSIASNTDIDVLILDIMLPDIDGYEVCRRIRAVRQPYIIMLSAKGDVEDRILGLETGADDYVSKPFSPREVAIKVKKVLNKAHPPAEERKLSLAELSLYLDTGQVFVGDKEVILSAKEISVLDYMLHNAGKILSREHILNAAWGYDYFGDTRVVDTMIKNLRKKLITDDVHFTISTIYGAGYRLTEKL